MLLDAGDLASYATGQVWADVSGAANNYNRGITSGAEASDPTFAGIAGDLSNREYFSFDGGDYLTPAAAPTFGATWHRSVMIFVCNWQMLCSPCGKRRRRPATFNSF